MGKNILPTISNWITESPTLSYHLFAYSEEVKNIINHFISNHSNYSMVFLNGSIKLYRKTKQDAK